MRRLPLAAEALRLAAQIPRKEQPMRRLPLTRKPDLRVCDECIRAVALIGPREGIGSETSFNTISRHPESIDLGETNRCALCLRGPGEYPADEFVDRVVNRRAGY